MSRHSICLQSRSMKKLTFYVMCKKENFVVKKSALYEFFLSFYTSHKKCRFFVKLGVHT
jgi:hypothetical protein